MSTPDRPSPLEFGGSRRPDPAGSTHRSPREDPARGAPIREWESEPGSDVLGAAVTRVRRDNGKTYRRLTVSVSAGLLAALEEAAEKDGKTVPGYLRDIIAWRVGM